MQSIYCTWHCEPNHRDTLTKATYSETPVRTYIKKSSGTYFVFSIPTGHVQSVLGLHTLLGSLKSKTV